MGELSLALSPCLNCPGPRFDRSCSADNVTNLSGCSFYLSARSEFRVFLPMTALGRQLLVKVAKLYDLAGMSLSFGLATVLVAHQTAIVSFADFFAMRVKIRNFVLFAGFLLVWNIIFRLFGLYDSRRLSGQKDELRDIVKASTLGVGSVCIAAFLLRLKMVTPLFVVGLWFISSATLVSSRLVARYLLSQFRVRGRNLREMLIVGTNPRAVLFARKIQANPTLGYRVLGFVDQEWEGMEEFRKGGYPLASDFERFPFLLRERVVDEVVLALPMKSLYLQASRVATLCEEQGIVVRVLSNIFNLRLAQSKAREFEGEAVTTFCNGSSEDWQHFFKRAFDIVASLVATLMLAPLFLLAGFLIKLTSQGPVFFIQERVGLNKKRFHLYKFRTMVADAEERQREIEHLNEASGPVFKIRSDPRLTPAGKFLRKTSIDELPQLFNVLKGDMSLVGPRPLPVRDYQGFDQDWQRRRFSVRPGITCLWQINGRSSIPFEKWMELDMQYIDQWSLWMDFKILAKTIPVVLKGTGAA
jgi:exopolysaccharide biosynthesis polyprenyl glycosylphosphotransferase